mmetsp:Transcript_31678/g.46329  ORF Transcript_31678/g.46329 Transcript_31678/m.46329 type:complete len:80 (-) Transcript_31678:240-479(-)
MRACGKNLPLTSPLQTLILFEMQSSISFKKTLLLIMRRYRRICGTWLIRVCNDRVATTCHVTTADINIISTTLFKQHFK